MVNNSVNWIGGSHFRRCYRYDGLYKVTNVIIPFLLGLVKLWLTLWIVLDGQVEGWSSDLPLRTEGMCPTLVA